MVRPVSGNPRPNTDARSFAALLDYGNLAERFRYRDGGRYLQYRLNAPRDVQYSDDYPALNFRPFAPAGAVYNSPPNPQGAALAVSYDNLRLGEWQIGAQVPDFEMIAASSDRVFAKVRGQDVFYLAMATPVYLHEFWTGGLALLPQSFFKLDPELGTNAPLADLQFHLTVAADDGRHLATERFPFFRAIFRLLEFPLVRHSGLRALFENMVVQAHPLVWHRMDNRPGRSGHEPPSEVPHYDHVTYRKAGPFGPRDNIRRSIAFDHVLDLGVGLSHLHEQYEPGYGGEMDNLDAKPFYADLYRFANGPYDDIGGYVDGTCIYYLLVRMPLVDPVAAALLAQTLAQNTPETEIANATLQNRYGVLWADEQFAFTERWRLLGTREREHSFVSPIKPMPGLAGPQPGPPWQFREDRFRDPLREGKIRAFSRMAIARQVVLINGFDKPDDRPGRHRIYSIHFGWPTMDRSWRARDLPAGAEPLIFDASVDEAGIERILGATQSTAVVPQTLDLREDMSLHLRGRAEIDGAWVNGHWVQKYLPPDAQEIPSAEVLANGSSAGLETAYAHPWQFYEETVFQRIHRGFSHFGVYQEVESRCQFYDVKPADSALSAATIEDTVWFDKTQALTIPRKELNWQRLGVVIDGLIPTLVIAALLALFLGPLPTSPLGGLGVFILALIVAAGAAWLYAVEWKHHPIIFEPVLRLRIRNTSRGPILLLHDKRDDKVRSFSGVPKLVSLSSEDDSITLDVSVVGHVHNFRGISARQLLCPPEVESVRVTSSVDASRRVVNVDFSITIARGTSPFLGAPDFQEWLGLNIDQVKVGALDGLVAVELAAFQREGLMVQGTDQRTLSFSWQPDPSHPRAADLVDLLSDRGQKLQGTSVWFVGLTGMAAIAGQTRFESRRV